ncbi:DUF6470 family protein [Bacillus suaedaesalsae]|uniref:Uncharacterized protein n=1 Tax=Bacillus suaedaesalsae TaxID=2810349 RepID=A0ABS2DKQ1_9BACI|nr:hypothetical protein [Bacillus suaedaesalsae]
MQVPQIRIESSYARLGMKTNDAQVAIEQPQDYLSIEQPLAEMNLSITPSKLTIDQSKAREDMDLKSILKRTEEAAQLGKTAVLEGIARRASEGNQLMKIENGGNAIAMIAKENSKGREFKFNIGWIPSPGSVKVEYTPSKVDVKIDPQKPIINVEPNKPILSYSPGKVEYMMEQYPSLKIDFVNLP